MKWSDVFYYDESSPTCLRWACSIPRVNQSGVIPGSYIKNVGDVAGSVNTVKGGYKRFQVKFQGKTYKVHRIVYELIHGLIDASLVVDHIDGNALNNVIDNLRLVSRAVNNRNSKKSISSVTGTNGVTIAEVVNPSGTYNYYCATWVALGGSCYHKYFSLLKYGDEEAFRLACEHRAKMIADLNAQGAGYTEDHGVRESQ